MKAFFIGSTELPKGLINNELADACMKAYEAGLERPDFEGTIFSNEIEEIVADCKKNNIREFTISSQSRGLQRTLAIFIEKGCRLEGLTKVCGEDAFLMEVI